MKKIIFLAVILAVSMVSCQNKQERIEEEQVEEKKVGTELRLFLEECLSKVPNAKDNKITMQELEDTITALMEKKVGDTLDIVYNYPVKIKKYKKCSPSDMFIEWCPDSPVVKNSGKYIVFFSNYYIDGLDSSERFRPIFEIITFMEPGEVKKLKDNAIYRIQGKFTGFAKEFRMPSADGGILTDLPSVFRDEDSALYLSLGTMIFENLKIETLAEESI